MLGSPRPLRNERTCFRFLKGGSLPAMALTSPPGAGNTWTRYLVEASTGIFTGSIYSDRSIYKSGTVKLGEY